MKYIDAPIGKKVSKSPKRESSFKMNDIDKYTQKDIQKFIMEDFTVTRGQFGMYFGELGGKMSPSESRTTLRGKLRNS